VVRTVKVELEADTGKYTPPVEKAKESTEGLKRKVKETDDQLQKIPPDAAKAAAAMKLLGDESGKAGLKLDDLNKRTSMDEIDRRLVKTRGEVRALASEFNRTGDSNILAKLFGKQGDLDDLEKLRSRLTHALGDAGTTGGKEFAKNFSSTSQGALSTPGLGPVIAGAIAGGVLLALPAISGLLMSAAGLGGIALGVAGQLGDQKVTQAFIDLRHRLSTELTAATVDFKEPLIATAGIFGDALSKSLHSIDFGSLSKLVVPVASGLGGLLTNLMPGFNHMLEQAVPLLRAMSVDLEHIGTGASLMFDMFAKGGKGAQESLRLLVYVLIGTMAAIGAVVLTVSKLFEWFVSAGHAVGDFASKLATSFPLINRWGEGVKKMFDSLNGANDIDVVARNLHKMGLEASYSDEQLALLSGQLNQTKITAESLAESMTTKVLDSMVAMDRATLSFEQSLVQVKDAVAQNGKSLDEHSTKGLNNRAAILGMVEANVAAFQANIANGQSLDEATAKYNANQAQIEKTAIAAYGNTAAVHSMIDKYKDVPGKIQTDIAMNGLTAAIDGLGDLLREIYGLPARREVWLTVHHDEITRHIDQDMGHVQRFGGIYQHAAEGLLSAKVYSAVNPGRYMIAEPATGGEAFVPRFGDYRRSVGILDQASRWYGGRFAPAGGMGGGGSMVTVPITINAGMGADGYALGRQIAETLRPYINSRGGDVQVALGK
jgi:hypothetical protein